MACGGFVFLASLAVFAALKATIGIRVKPDQELDGLDIHEHGVFGYPDLVATDYQNGNGHGSSRAGEKVEAPPREKVSRHRPGALPAGAFSRPPLAGRVLYAGTRANLKGTEGSLEAPITQATAHNNTIVAVFPDRVEIRSGWQSQNVESFNLRRSPSSRRRASSTRR